MDPKTNLTIQDYFNNTGIGSKRRSARDGPAVSTHRQGNTFGQILDATQAQSGPVSASSPKGMTIATYRARTVRAANPRVSAAPGEGQAFKRSTLLTAVRPGFQPPIHTARDTAPSAVPPGASPEAISHSAENGKNSDPLQAKISHSIHKAAKKFNLAPELLHAMVKAESNYQVDAVSPAGAQGLMQLMPGTAKDLGVSNPFDIDQNISGGARYLRWMLDRFDGDLNLALAAYNAGPETVTRYGRQVPPYPETRTYIERVMRYSNQQAG